MSSHTSKGNCVPASSASSSAKPYHHGNLREAIKDAALDVLAREGASAVSLRDLARSVGVGHSSIYAHFRDRSDLLAAIAGAGFAELLQQMNAARSRPGDSVANLAASYLHFARTSPAYYKAMFLPETSRPENICHVKGACEQCFQVLIEALGQNASLSVPETRERAVGIWSSLHGLAMLGDDAGPLHNHIAPDSELDIASSIANAVAKGPWRPG